MARTITILLEDAHIEDREKIENYCKENNLGFTYRYSRNRSFFKTSPFNESNEDIVPLWYFTIFGTTKDYDALNTIMDNRLLLTDFAEFGNLADKDEDFMSKLVECVEECRLLTFKEMNCNRRFCDFIKMIDDPKTLNAFVDSYGGLFSDFQKKLVQNRMDILNNEQHYSKEEMLEVAKSLSCDVSKLRELTGMTRRAFADYFEIPYRTVEDWEKKKSTCSSYLYKLMVYRLRNELGLEI